MIANRSFRVLSAVLVLAVVVSCSFPDCAKAEVVSSSRRQHIIGNMNAFEAVVDRRLQLEHKALTPASLPLVRGIAVIVDFADATLENYTGGVPGAVTTVSQLRGILDSMENHWATISLGQHLMKWDIIRIKLDQSLTSHAFSDYVSFRTAVVQKALTQINESQYDADRDGIVDTMWIFVADHGNTIDIPNQGDFPYLVGGTLRAGAANTFVDGQTDPSVTAGEYGNFNHEVGHCFGLVDLYGNYSNLGNLDLMSYPRGTAPPGFSAFHRWKLGWSNPLQISISGANRSTIYLNPAEESFDSVYIPTSVQGDYFLVEYPKTRNGLAIYHVNENALGNNNNNAIPPLLRLEPVDGIIEYGVWPDANDFWFPGNPVMTGPFVGRSYGDPNTELFMINRISSTSGGMQFDVVTPAWIKEMSSAVAPIISFILEDDPTITVTAPNGGDTWIAGTQQTISWTYKGDPGATVNIALLINGVVSVPVASDVPIGTNGTGSYSWMLPNTLTPGSNFQIGVTSASNALYAGTSNNNFFIACNPFSVATIGPFPFTSIWNAYVNATSPPGSATIKIVAGSQQGTLNFNEGKMVTLRGGYDCAFDEPPVSISTITGTVIVSSGTAILNNIGIQ